jgi:4-hydroxythreonine-4-phosphate dehydrogenase
MSQRPRIALTLGDPAGIGPEIVFKALEEKALLARMQLLLLGPASLRPAQIPLAQDPESGDWPALAWCATPAPDPWESGQIQASAGRAALGALYKGSQLGLAGALDALVTAPVSKEALHLAGEEVEGQTQLLGRLAERDVEMLAIAGELRVLLLTRHMPLRKALDAISSEAVLHHLNVLNDGLKAMGFPRPKLGLAGLNPHAGERGILGSEEIELLAPAVEAARAAGLLVSDPLPPDTIFIRGQRGEFDGILALYHDQAFIPVKLAAPTSGLTVLLGLPYLRVSPAHGTAFDIAGQGKADPSNLILALKQAAEWSS